MKNIYITSLIICMLGMSSCLDDFLDKPEHNMTPELELDNAVKLSNSIYASFIRMGEGQGDALYSLGEIASDNALRGSILSDGGGLHKQRLFNQFQNFDGLNPTSDNYIESLWNGLYPGIDQANINIRAMERLFPTTDVKLKTALIAENRFAKAWFYMHLVNTFGNVVIIPDEEITPKEYADLTNDKSVLELYNYLIADLRFAAENLPTKNEWSNDLKIAWQGRAHNGSANGYLAKALLYQAANHIYYEKGNAKATECYKEIVDIVAAMQSDYQLVADYENIFRESGNYNTESLFEVGTKSTADGSTRFAGWRPIQPRGYQGYGRLAPSLNLINQYEKGADGTIIDQRYRGTVLFGETTPLSGMQHPGKNDFMRSVNGDLIEGIKFTNSALAAGWPNRYCRKSVQPRPASTGNNASTNLGGGNLKFLRWGEVLLVGAEAAYHINDMVSARTWLKLVRQRAGLDTDMIDAMSGDDLLQQIWKDKRLEIALEWSNRYYELVRIDKIKPGYMKASMNSKIEDELKGIKNHLDKTSGWSKIYNAKNFPITPENYKTLMPLSNEVQLPKHYTMPISTRIFTTMLNVKQTSYYQ